MKCVDCGAELKEEKIKKEIHVTLHNPGKVCVTGQVLECQSCKQYYVDEEEALRLLEAFEHDRLDKNGRK